MLLSNWTTVERVEKLSDGAVYCRLEERVTAVAAFGRVRAELRAAVVTVFLATAPAVDRKASILRFVYEWRVFVRDRKGCLPAPEEQRSGVRNPKQERMRSFIS